MSIQSIDIKSLMEEIENSIQKKINSVINNYMDRYNLLEQTHEQIMKLPSVAYELNKSNSNSISKSCEIIKEPVLLDASYNSNNLIMCQCIFKLENKMDNLEENFEKIVCILDKLLKETEPLAQEPIVVPSVVPNVVPNVVYDFIKIIEPDNIQIHIEDLSVEDDDDVPVDDDDVPVEEEEVVPVEEEEVVPVEEEEVVPVEEEEEEEDVDVEEDVEEVVPVEEKDDNSVETETRVEEEEEEEEEELFEIEIEDITYCTNDEENGVIWELTEEGEQGKKVGYLDKGEACFY